MDDRILKPTPGILKTEDDLVYGLRGVVRVLSRRGDKNGYFFERISVLFNSELEHEVKYEQTYLDHENLKIVIELPDPSDVSEKETIRSQKNKEYTFGADDFKTRAALSAWESLDQSLKDSLIKKQKELQSSSK